MALRLDGKSVALAREERLTEEIRALRGRPPTLAVFLVGEHPASQVYVRNKRLACERVGIRSVLHDLPATVSENGLISHIEAVNDDPSVDGILVQMPLPEGISPERVIRAVSPEKDVDGFHPLNMGRLLLGESGGFLPCTPLGITTLLHHYGLSPAGKHVVIVGRSNIVGKPLAALLLRKGTHGDATVTVVHSRTPNPKEICRQADILVTALGVRHFIGADDVKEGAVVVDVGINALPDPSRKKGFRLVGDVDFEAVVPRCHAITPVPGGIGPMTIAMLLENTVDSYRRTHR